MKYYLIVDFKVNIYRKPPMVRIFINDIFLDELTIEESHIKLLVVDENILNTSDNLQNTIGIDVFNNDNNYNNGFCSKGTTLLIDNLYLLNEKLFFNNEVYDRRWRWNRQKVKIEDIVIWYKERNRVYANLINNSYLKYSVKEDILNYKKHLGYLGGTFYFFAHVYFKKGITVSNRDRFGRMNLGNNEYCLYIVNKYKQYEDQRSANT